MRRKLRRCQQAVVISMALESVFWFEVIGERFTCQVTEMAGCSCSVQEFVPWDQSYVGWFSTKL